MRLTSTLFAAAIAATLPAQNLIPNGDFEQGATGWTMTFFNDPLGTTGLAAARTTGNGPSLALYADFKTVFSVAVYTTWRTAPFPLPQQMLPVSFNAMWEKLETAPIYAPSVNQVELRIYDASDVRVFQGALPAPGQTGLFERARFTGTFDVPAAGLYTAELFVRHSNLAGVPFISRVDDVVLGEAVSSVYGQGCAGSGGFVPVLNSVNVPAINTSDFAIELHDAFAPATVMLALGASDTNWDGTPLPISLGAGCSMLTGPVALLVQMTTGNGAGSGTATERLAFPNDPSLQGARLYVQWLIADPAANNPYGLVTTAAMKLHIQ